LDRQYQLLATRNIDLAYFILNISLGIEPFLKKSYI